MTAVVPPSSARAESMRAFLAAAGWAEAECALLAGDASFRKYYRLNGGKGRAVLMDAPPPQEDIRPFVAIARHLLAAGFSAPRPLAEDPANGFLLLEDFGDATYTRLLAAGEAESGETEEALYALATDVLAALAALAPPPGVPAYDTDRLLAETALLPDWFLPAVGAAPSAAARAAWDDAWRAVLPLVPAAAAPVLVLRDFHVDNLMLLPGRTGVAACGLLDFQDAVSGSPAYDLMSLVEDARRDIAPALAEAMVARFLAARPEIDAAAFRVAFAVLAAQRHAKVIGIFTRLWKRDGKPGYLVHLPRVWRLLERACTHPALAPVRGWLDTHAPPTTRRRTPA